MHPADEGLDREEVQLIRTGVKPLGGRERERSRTRPSHPRAPGDQAATPAAVQTLRAALEALARVLAGPRAQRYRIASTSKPESHYTIDVDGGDVTCSCPGFEYRGQCRHARDVKTALASGGAPPADYVPVA